MTIVNISRTARLLSAALAVASAAACREAPPDLRKSTDVVAALRVDSLSCSERDAVGPCTRRDVNIYELLTRPERFHDKRIRVMGYAQWDQMGDDALYANAEDAAHHLFFSAIGLGRPASADSLIDGYVLVEGTFRIGPHGHLGAWRAGVGSLTRLDRWTAPHIPPAESIPEIDLSRKY